MSKAAPKLSWNQEHVLKLVRDGRPYMGATHFRGAKSGRGNTLLSLYRLGLISVEDPHGYLLTARGVTYLSTNHPS